MHRCRGTVYKQQLFNQRARMRLACESRCSVHDRGTVTFTSSNLAGNVAWLMGSMYSGGIGSKSVNIVARGAAFGVAIIPRSPSCDSASKRTDRSTGQRSGLRCYDRNGDDVIDSYERCYVCSQTTCLTGSTTGNHTEVRRVIGSTVLYPAAI